LGINLKLCSTTSKTHKTTFVP